jgi:hypothetical protein
VETKVEGQINLTGEGDARRVISARQETGDGSSYAESTLSISTLPLKPVPHVIRLQEGSSKPPINPKRLTPSV